MTVEIPWLGVILATASSFVIGGIWYGPKTFYPRWQKIVGVSNDYMKKSFGPSIPWMLISSLIVAYVMVHAINYAMYFTGTSGVSAGLLTALWIWLGFVFTTILTTNALDPRDKMIIAIQAGNQLLTYLAMGAILGIFIQ